MRPLVFYHDPCVSGDGFGAAFAAWCKFGDDADYVGADYGKPPAADYVGREVYVLDFCYPRAIMEDMLAKASSLVVLDHHKTAMEDIAGLPGATFDMTKSGARLAWEYFHPGTTVPMLLQHVEDRDLWVWRLPHSKDFLAYLDTQPKTFAAWQQLHLASLYQLDDLLAKGQAINLRLAAMVEEQLPLVTPVTIAGIDGHQHNVSAPLVNDLGARLFALHGMFALLWVVEHGWLKISLRSGEGGVDVAALARRFGGGGHAQSAGFRFPVGSPEGQEFMMKYLLCSGD